MVVTVYLNEIESDYIKALIELSLDENKAEMTYQERLVINSILRKLENYG